MGWLAWREIWRRDHRAGGCGWNCRAIFVLVVVLTSLPGQFEDDDEGENEEEPIPHGSFSHTPCCPCWQLAGLSGWFGLKCVS